MTSITCRLVHHIAARRLSVDWGSIVLSQGNVSAVNVSGFINILQLLSVVFVLPHVSFIVVRVSYSVQFCVEPFVNF